MTTGTIEHYGLWAFPMLFIGLWLSVTILLGILSGWYGLMVRFPDRPEPAMLKLKWQSGTIGWVGTSNILYLSVCPSGLRVGIWRVFGPFCRDFLVPWKEITVRRRNRILWKSVELKFGSPSSGRLVIQSYIADHMALAAPGHWPESGPFFRETTCQMFRRIMVESLLPLAILPVFLVAVMSFSSMRADLRLSDLQAAEFVIAVTLFYVVMFGTFGLIRFFATWLISRRRL